MITHPTSPEKSAVLLVVCPMWDVSIPPLGIGYLASYLESKGIPVDVLDINVETYARGDSQRKKFWKMDIVGLDL